VAADSRANGGAALARDDIERAYREYRHSVLRRARQMLGSDQAAAEVVQEVFVSLIRDPAQFHGGSSIATWLYSATTHLCLNKIRDRDNQARLLAQHFAPAQRDEVRPPEAESLAAARQLLGRLPESLARVAVYHYFDGLTHDEIGALLGCSRRYVGKLLARVVALSGGGEEDGG
jgi:RNA polymerase sigma factor (sigma-70 family)